MTVLSRKANSKLAWHQTMYLYCRVRCCCAAGGRGMKPTTRTRAQNPLPKFFEVAKWLYTIILFKTFWGIYTMLCINNVWEKKIFLSDSHIRQKTKFSNFQGYETHYPSRGFFLRLFSFQGLIIGLISTTVVFFYRSFCKVST